MVRTNGTERMLKDSTFFDIIRKKKRKTKLLDKELRKIIIETHIGHILHRGPY